MYPTLWLLSTRRIKWNWNQHPWVQSTLSSPVMLQLKAESYWIIVQWDSCQVHYGIIPISQIEKRLFQRLRSFRCRFWNKNSVASGFLVIQTCRLSIMVLALLDHGFLSVYLLVVIGGKVEHHGTCSEAKRLISWKTGSEEWERKSEDNKYIPGTCPSDLLSSAGLPLQCLPPSHNAIRVWPK